MSYYEIDNAGVIKKNNFDVDALVTDNYHKSLDKVDSQGQVISVNITEGSLLRQFVDLDIILIQQLTNFIIEVCNNFNIKNAINKDYAGSIWGFTRKNGVKAVITASVTSPTAQTMYEGFTITDGENDFQTISKYNFSAQSTQIVFFESVKNGVIAIEDGSINIIKTPGTNFILTPNSKLITNGTETENDTELIARVNADNLQIKAGASFGAVCAKLRELEDVIQLNALENYKDIPTTMNGVNMPAHSAMFCIYGGKESDFAKIFYNNRIGCTLVGNKSIGYINDTLQDVSETQVYYYYRPTIKEFYLTIKYSRTVQTPQIPDDKVKEYLMQYFSNNPFKIGKPLLLSQILQPLQEMNIFNVNSLEMSVDGVTPVNYINNLGTEMPIFDPTKLTIIEM